MTFSIRLSKPAILATLFSLSLVGAAAQAATCKNKSDLPPVTGNVVNVYTVQELQSAASNLSDNTTILISPGTYNLSSTLWVQHNNVTIRGDGNSCGDVVLVGKGMDVDDNTPHGIWTNASNLTVMNLTIRDVYYHGIILNPGAQSPTLDSIQVFDAGEQLVKSNPTSIGVGVDNGVVQNSVFAYTNGTPKTDHGIGIGYTNGVDVLGGHNWVVRNNRFENLHNPDGTDWPWNPAVLMWQGTSNIVVENNVFVNVDRAIAFGLVDRNGNGHDNEGGIIRNNMIYYPEGLYSPSRKVDSDGTIIVWDSPNTIVAHNTVLSNGNLNKSIEFRFNTTGAQAVNNLVDAIIGTRDSGSYADSGNLFSAVESMFKNPAQGDLRLQSGATSVMGMASYTSAAPKDVDGQARNASGSVDVGADEFAAISPPNPPSNVNVSTVNYRVPPVARGGRTSGEGEGKEGGRS